VTFVTINTFVADMAMLSAWGFNNFAIETQVFAWDPPQNIDPVEIRVRFKIAGLVSCHESERKC
jgi:hypothetical protein